MAAPSYVYSVVSSAFIESEVILFCMRGCIAQTVLRQNAAGPLG